MKKVLTYHVHGSYLFYLTRSDMQFFLPVKKSKESGFFGKSESFDWGENVYEIPAENIKKMDFDAVIFQSNFNPQKPGYDYLKDQTEILSSKQLLNIPKVFIEHDPPRDHPTDSLHPLVKANMKNITLVHITPFNRLMWDNGNIPVKVIDHGVIVQKAGYSGKIARGIVVVNNIKKRGRRLGLDIFEKVRKEVALDLIGMGSKEIGGLGEIHPSEVTEFISKYRFFFNPIRYTSLGLAVIEAMQTGLPVVAFATTEQAQVLKSGRGVSSTSIEKLISSMKTLIKDKDEAKSIGEKGKNYAEKRFSIERFKKDWESLIYKITTDRYVKKIRKKGSVQNYGERIIL